MIGKPLQLAPDIRPLFPERVETGGIRRVSPLFLGDPRRQRPLLLLNHFIK